MPTSTDDLMQCYTDTLASLTPAQAWAVECYETISAVIKRRVDAAFSASDIRLMMPDDLDRKIAEITSATVSEFFRDESAARNLAEMRSGYDANLLAQRAKSLVNEHHQTVSVRETFVVGDTVYVKGHTRHLHYHYKVFGRTVLPALVHSI